ncbi:HAD family hydrolase [Streptomyces echinoruber]|jgi:hypothetical protein|uniref:Uncharacterized protein n=1 Tax=Streptomyces echinoruber TaxID=68898 RepID=A0A918RGE7_9ACTN|nr:haloacid dehalogenase-like hydrolase [Streptomyces echinoruber]GGZ97845.1 hypothetical protein GCM10010389_41350 [Streptomyces echinoruber]
MNARRTAFFFLDVTLGMAPSVTDFVRFWQGRQGAVTDNRGDPRLLTRAEAEECREELLEAGRVWAAGRGVSAAWADSVLPELLRRHRLAGDELVLVSTSFAPCVRPVAELLGMPRVLCVEPALPDGRPTLDRAPRSRALAQAVVETMILLGSEAARCFGYADHADGLDMLAVVGNPRPVGVDPVLLRTARERGWLPVSVRRRLGPVGEPDPGLGDLGPRPGPGPGSF